MVLNMISACPMWGFIRPARVRSHCHVFVDVHRRPLFAQHDHRYGLQLNVSPFALLGPVSRQIVICRNTLSEKVSTDGERATWCKFDCPPARGVFCNSGNLRSCRRNEPCRVPAVCVLTPPAVWLIRFSTQHVALGATFKF